MTTDPRSYDRIRPQIRAALDRWAEKGGSTGSFIQAVLSNNLVDAVGRADDENLVALPAIVAYVYNELPSGSWGSPSKVKSWHDDHYVG